MVIRATSVKGNDFFLIGGVDFLKKFSVMFQLFSVVARWLRGSAHLLTCSARLGIGSARLGGSAHKLHAHAHAPRNKATACRLVGLARFVSSFMSARLV